ncbi:MAG: PH domain-containing protein [Chloroflexi bacterium]|nr:PH domain-containing protein [Chloroflexota bacterium]
MAKVNIRPDQDERFIYTAHRHWVALLIRCLIPTLVGLLAIGIFVSRAFNREPDFFGQAPPLFDPLNIFLFVSVLVTIGILAYIWFDWRNDHLIVSNKRIIHEDRTLWLSYIYETIPLEQIQNVNVRIENIFQYTLKYGRIEIQAAGPTEPIVFLRVECPTDVQRQILGEVQREKRNQERRYLEATVAHRIDPNVPSPAVQPLPIYQRAATQQTPIQALLPFGPLIQNGIITWHRHWIVLLKNMIGPVIALLLWLLLLYAFPRVDWLDPRIEPVVLVVTLIAVGLYFYWQYEDWRNDIYILEPSKVIDVQRLPFGLYEDRREATLGVIQNVNASSPNVIARILATAM